MSRNTPISPYFRAKNCIGSCIGKCTIDRLLLLQQKKSHLFSLENIFCVKNASCFSDSLVESESLSSGVGTSSHSGSAGSSTTPTESHPPSLILQGMHVVCLENFSNPNLPNGLHITQGDIIEGKNFCTSRAKRGL